MKLLVRTRCTAEVVGVSGARFPALQARYRLHDLRPGGVRALVLGELGQRLGLERGQQSDELVGVEVVVAGGALAEAGAAALRRARGSTGAGSGRRAVGRTLGLRRRNSSRSRS